MPYRFVIKNGLFSNTNINTRDEVIKADIHTWYYRDDDNSEKYPGVDFGTVSGKGYTQYVDDPDKDGGYITIGPEEKLELTLTGTIPNTWNIESAITVVVDAYEDGYMGQADYSGRIDISDAKVTMRPSSTKTYNGKDQKLAKGDVIVTCEGKTLVEGKDYRIEYDDDPHIDYKSPGSHFAWIDGIGGYTGWNEAYYTIEFKDVTDEGEFYYDYVYQMADMDITKGWEDGTFRPFETINRAAVVTFMARLDEIL